MIDSDEEDIKDLHQECDEYIIKKAKGHLYSRLKMLEKESLTKEKSSQMQEFITKLLKFKNFEKKEIFLKESLSKLEMRSSIKQKHNLVKNLMELLKQEHILDIESSKSEDEKESQGSFIE